MLTPVHACIWGAGHHYPGHQEHLSTGCPGPGLSPALPFQHLPPNALQRKERRLKTWGSCRGRGGNGGKERKEGVNGLAQCSPWYGVEGAHLVSDHRAGLLAITEPPAPDAFGQSLGRLCLHYLRKQSPVCGRVSLSRSRENQVLVSPHKIYIFIFIACHHCISPH